MYRLALALGYASVSRLQDDLSDEEFLEWVAFFELEPWGSDVGFLHAGIVASTIVNASPNRKQGLKPVTPADFMPKSREQQRREDQRSLRAALFGAFGRDAKGRKEE